jgi:hypothetical protein
MQEDNPSAFAPKQLVLAHAAVADPRLDGCVMTSAPREPAWRKRRRATARVWLEDCRRITRDGYVSRILAREFQYPDSRFCSRAIASRKGPKEIESQYYYSGPLSVNGTITVEGKSVDVKGLRRGSITMVEPAWWEAAGWDWIGINLSDGGAVGLSHTRRDEKTTRTWARRNMA